MCGIASRRDGPQSGGMPPSHWVHDLSPFLIEFSNGFGIRYYGLAYVLGFAAAAGLMHLYARRQRSSIRGELISDLMTYIVIGVLVGGRLGYFLLYQSDWLRRDPLALLRVWEGGMASHGGFVGVLAALAWWARKRRIPLLHVADVVVSTAPLGLFFGRIANFINGELWGKITDFKYAVIFPQSDPRTPVALVAPRHASQLYEAALEGVVLFALMQWRFWKTDVVRTRPGRLGGEFLLAYALLRIIGEHFREPDASLLLGVSRGTFYSVFLIVAGLVLILRPARPAAAPPP